MRAIAAWTFVAACAASGCAASRAMTPPEEGELLVVALRSCVPSWMPVTGFDVPIHGAAMVGIRTEPTTYGLDVDEVECILRAGSDCGAVRNCVGIELYVDETCTAPSRECVGGAVVTCVPADPGMPRPPTRGIQSCAHGGGFCDPSTVACVRPSCPPETAVSSCENGVAITRCPGVETRWVCDPPMECSLGRCVGTGAPCTDDVCDGDSTVWCDHAVGREIRHVDCTAWGAHCRRDDIGLRCTGDGGQCNFATAPGCLGGDVMYCGVDGTFRTYDCVAHGFGPCETDGPVSDGRARCGPAGERLF